MQIDESDEQPVIACDSIRESLEPNSLRGRLEPNSIGGSREPDSNVTLERATHRMKHCSPRTSTDDGMQIDESDEQSKNAPDPTRESFEPDSNLKLETVRFPEKQLQSNSSISAGMIIACALPKYRMIDVRSELTRKSSRILKRKLPSSIEIHVRVVQLMALGSSRKRAAGMQIDESDEQSANVDGSIRESLEPDSNVTCESALHPRKHLSPRTATDDGMQIDRSDEHLT
jgi:hypothetical protein